MTDTQELEAIARAGKAKHGGIGAFLRAAGVSASTFARMRRGYDYRASSIEKLRRAAGEGSEP